MKFEEAQSQVENLVGDLNIPLGVEGALLNIVEKLQTQYAPIVKMTQYQAETMLMMKENHEDFIDVIIDTDSEEIVPELDKFWSPLKNEELMQAWLHPDSIETID